VHPNPEGNCLLAKAVFEQLLRLLGPTQGDAVAAGTISPERCFRAIALTQSNRFQMQKEVAASLRRPPFSAQLDAGQRQLEQAKLLAELEASANAPRERQKASQWYATAIDRSPGDPLLRREYPRLLQRHGNEDAAEQQWRKLTRQYPYVAAWRLEFGEFLLHRGVHQEAIAEFHEVTRMDPSLGGPAAVGIASALVQQGDSGGAEQVLRRALQGNSHPVLVHHALGTLYLRYDRPGEAIGQFQQVLRIDPNLAAPHANLAVIYAQQANVAEAVRHCRELLRIEPGTAETVEVLQEVSRLTGGRNDEIRELRLQAQGEGKGAET
jgi:tetratricopeptide (TPR) repeat protein